MRPLVLAIALATAMACAGAPAVRSAPPDAATLLAAERALMDAIASRDPARVAPLLGDEFVLRVPGAADVDKAGFLAAVAALPAGLTLEGEALAARPLGDGRGLVSGVQVARVHADGGDVVDRQAFVDLFERRDDRWVVTFAHSVSVPSAP